MGSKSIFRWIGHINDILPPYNFDLSVQALGSSMPPARYNDKTYKRALKSELLRFLSPFVFRNHVKTPF